MPRGNVWRHRALSTLGDMRPRRIGLVAAIGASLAALIAGVAILARPAVWSARPAAADGPARPRPAGSGADVHTRTAGVPLDPAYFSPGACMAFAPTAGDRHLTVFLDAGHGGPDPGAIGTTSSGRTIHEADETLPVVLDTMTNLRRDGFRVVVSRTGPTSVLRLRPADLSGHILTGAGSHADVVARDVCANLARADILIGVYLNSGSTGAAGCLTAFDPARTFASDNRRLAGLVQSSVLDALNARGWRIPNDGVLSDQGLGSAVTAADQAYGHLVLLGPAKHGYLSTPSMMPGALIEPLFITDPFEATIAASTIGQQVMAAGLTRAVLRYFAPRTG